MKKCKKRFKRIKTPQGSLSLLGCMSLTQLKQKNRSSRNVSVIGVELCVQVLCLPSCSKLLQEKTCNIAAVQPIMQTCSARGYHNYV